MMTINQTRLYVSMLSIFLFNACSLFLEDPAPYPPEKDQMVKIQLPIAKDRDINTETGLDANLSQSSKALSAEELGDQSIDEELDARFDIEVEP